MNVIFCTDIPELTLLSYRATNILLANNFRLLKQIILESCPNKYFAITTYHIHGLRVYDVQFLEFERRPSINDRTP